MTDEPYGLVLSFTGLEFGETTEHAYVHGFEMGQLWQRMRGGHEAEIAECFHASNRVAIERAATSQGWMVEVTPTEYAEWIDVKLTKAKPATSNPHGLRVVN
jgi:1,4-alpha-glucan branching enzyme